jgi:hypothetical protein
VLGVVLMCWHQGLGTLLPPNVMQQAGSVSSCQR